MRLVSLLLRSELREPPVLFWQFAFPIILMTVFGLVYLGGGGEERIRVYGYALDEWGEGVLVRLGEAFDVTLVANVSDPRAFVAEATARDLKPATLVVVGRDRVEVYSASSIWGQVVLGTVVFEVLDLQGVSLDVNASLTLVEEAESWLGLGPLRLATVLALVLPIQAGVVGVLAISAVLVYTGVSKRIAMASVSRIKTGLVVAAAEFLVLLASLALLLAYSWVVFEVDVARLVSGWAFWAGFLINYATFAGVGLAMSRLTIYVARNPFVLVNAGVSIFLLVAFLSGYFIPIEVMPRDVAAAAAATPMYRVLAVAYGQALSGVANPVELAYPAGVAVAALLIGLALFELHRRV